MKALGPSAGICRGAACKHCWMFLSLYVSVTEAAFAAAVSFALADICLGGSLLQLGGGGGFCPPC